ncbi:PTS sugar transporter subunit IIBC [Flavobacterium sp. J27]|uniref:PTS sugar transporter subunit IIBC n=1 Tax=Flavobacterium sp. J27 TaxID=2060419 RepID=UPI00103027A6|nr:PTS sugar transporter subunit IIBC [Flavobacterium sp. J27]
MGFIDKKVSIKHAITALAKNGIVINDNEAAVILDFLYFMSKNYNKPKDGKEFETLERNRTSEKPPKRVPK